MTTTESNVWGGASGHTYTFTRQPDGTTDIDAVVVREGKNLKGRALAIVLGTVGKRVLVNEFGKTVKAIEARNESRECQSSYRRHVGTSRRARSGSGRARRAFHECRGCGRIREMDPPVELRQLRYFVAVAEELHFGRAAERLHMSQSPLSRAIRELERDVGAVLFIRTTRHVELTPAGSALLSRARVALTEVDVALDEARRAAQPGPEVIAIGHGPFSRSLAERVAEQVADGHPDVDTRLVEGVAPELAGRVASHELAGALMLETPAAARRYGVRIDAVRDEPLLAALPKTHRYADAEAIPIGAFAEELVLLPREPAGRAFNQWLRAVVRGAGYELEQTLET